MCRLDVNKTKFVTMVIIWMYLLFTTIHTYGIVSKSRINQIYEVYLDAPTERASVAEGTRPTLWRAAVHDRLRYPACPPRLLPVAGPPRLLVRFSGPLSLPLSASPYLASSLLVSVSPWPRGRNCFLTYYISYQCMFVLATIYCNRALLLLDKCATAGM